MQLLNCVIKIAEHIVKEYLFYKFSKVTVMIRDSMPDLIEWFMNLTHSYVATIDFTIIRIRIYTSR